MRSIVASLIVFLVVTAVLLHRTSAHDDIAPQAAAAAVASATAPAAQTPAPTATIGRSLSQAPSLATTQPTATRPTQPAPTASPTAEPVEVVDSAATEPVASESEPTEPDTTAHAQLASVGTEPDPLSTGGWADAIRTLDGGVMAMVLSESANVRSAPTTDAPVVTELHAGWPITLYGTEIGGSAAGTDLWFRTWSGSYVSAATVGPFVAPQPAETFSGHWVDVDLTTGYAVAYIDATPVYAAISITGKPGFETPAGTFSIFRRVELDTLDSATTGIPDGDPESYRLENVPYVQYFADGGFALHANYWSDPWEYGHARSHGCINLMEEDAAWFWQFLSIGSTVSIHH